MATCGKKCMVYSRVVGYYRPTENFNVGKRAEFEDRVPFSVEFNKEKFEEERREFIKENVPVEDIQDLGIDF